MLHSRDARRDDLDDDLFASTDLEISVPKYRIPERENDPRHAYQIVADELMLDGNSRQNLATFCQTWLEPEVHRLMDLTLDKNMIDKDEYPQTAELEARCVHMLADSGTRPTRPTRWARRRPGRARRRCSAGWRCTGAGASARAAGKPTDRPNLVTGPVQVCWHKFTRYWGVEHPRDPDGRRPADHDRRRSAGEASTRTRSASCPRSA